MKKIVCDTEKKECMYRECEYTLPISGHVSIENKSVTVQGSYT